MFLGIQFFTFCILGHSDVPTSTLFVGRIPYSLTKEELIELFPGCSSARIISNPATGFSKGYVGFNTHTHTHTHICKYTLFNNFSTA